jgi:hypothetical protein
MWNKSVTLYIDDTSIRLLVTRRQRVYKWADLNLEPDLIKGSVVIQEAEVAGRLKQLFKEHNVRAKKVSLGFSGLHSLTRPAVLPEMPATMLKEAITREARRVLPAPLDQLYLSWSYLPSSKSRIRLFMVGLPRKTADSMVKTLRLAGLEPRRMGIKPLFLTRIVPVNNAIVIDAQPKEFDIIIMKDGVPQPIRTVPFPEQELTPEDRLQMVISDLERTVKFYDANNPDGLLEPDFPIYVSGDLTENATLQKMLSGTSGHPVIPLNTLLKGQEQIDAGRYMVNMALAARTPPPSREPTFSASDLNVLPASYQPKPISLTRVIGIPGGAAAVALVVPVMLLLQSTSANMEAIQAQVDITNQLADQRTAQKLELNKTIAGLKKQAAAAKLTYDGLAYSLNALKADQKKINGNMSLVLSVLPPVITLTGLNESTDRLTITGKAGNESDVLKYARDLDASGRFTETVISSMAVGPSGNATVAGTGEITFTLILICRE